MLVSSHAFNTFSQIRSNVTKIMDKLDPDGSNSITLAEFQANSPMKSTGRPPPMAASCSNHPSTSDPQGLLTPLPPPFLLLLAFRTVSFVTPISFRFSIDASGPRKEIQPC